MTRISRLAAIAELSMLASANYLLPALGPGMPTSQRRPPRSAPDENDKERLRAADAKRARRASRRIRSQQ